MKNLKTFKQHNEEMKWKDVKKAAAGVALGAGLALGSPQQVAGQTPQQQEQRLPQDVQHSTVIQMPGKSIDDIQDHLYDLMNDIRVHLYDARSVITSLNYQPFGENKIKAEVQFDLSPKNTRGVTEAEIEISIKEGRYKIVVKNIDFKYVGYQPNSPSEEIASRYRPLVGTAASGAVRRAFGGKLGGAGDVLGNVAASALQGYALKQPKPKEDFELKTGKKATPEGVTSKNYEKYLEEVDSAVHELFAFFEEDIIEDDF